METQRRTLVLVRHAKAEDYGPSDHARALTDRGRRDAADVGRRLGAAQIVPSQALVSDALRTQQTYQEIASAAVLDAALVSSAALYAAGPDTALDLIRETDDAVATLLVVGHNPTMAYLAQALDDGEGNLEASTAMVAGFPTSACAVFTVTGSWIDLRAATTSLVDFWVGRG
ncbi:histidine phosphatase family protein [Nocardioides dubius]|uniref:Histidine phosphatase family protein n=1 Tax=Nocardioides dubius TaxID=317019 RepID=A0ABN1TQ20_9ACTN